MSESNPTTGQTPDPHASEQAQPLPTGLLADFPWLTFLLPFIVYMLVQTLEPTPGADGGSSLLGLTIRYEHYPLVYSAKIALTILAMLFVWPGYRTFPFRISPLSIVVGVVGVVVWIALCQLQLEARLLTLLRLDWLVDVGERSAFNPLEYLAANPAWAYGFLAIRFLGLALVVPVIEEFFLRGFLMRMMTSVNWWKKPFGQVDTAAIVAGTVVPMLMHPGELLAAMVWFSAVTWLMIRTRNIWDCVAAHLVTNLLLGIYVVTTGQWELW